MAVRLIFLFLIRFKIKDCLKYIFYKFKSKLFVILLSIFCVTSLNRFIFFLLNETSDYWCKYLLHLIIFSVLMWRNCFMCSRIYFTLMKYKVLVNSKIFEPTFIERKNHKKFNIICCTSVEEFFQSQLLEYSCILFSTFFVFFCQIFHN